MTSLQQNCVCPSRSGSSDNTASSLPLPGCGITLKPVLGSLCLVSWTTCTGLDKSVEKLWSS